MNSNASTARARISRFDRPSRWLWHLFEGSANTFCFVWWARDIVVQELRRPTIPVGFFSRLVLWNFSFVLEASTKITVRLLLQFALYVYMLWNSQETLDFIKLPLVLPPVIDPCSASWISGAGITISKRRNRLKGDIVEALKVTRSRPHRHLPSCSLHCRHREEAW